MLGFGDQIFYDDGNPLSTGTTDYARICDFTIGIDVIILPLGNNYRLGSSPVQGQSGTGVFTDNLNGSTELIAIVQNVEFQSLDLNNPSQFFFI